EWRNDCAAIDRIHVGLRLSHPPRMEIRLDLLRFANTNRRRQESVTAAMELLGREFRMRPETYDLPPGVNARIGPAGALDIQAFLRELLDHVGQGALNCGLAGLDLPAAKIGAVIG